MLILNLMRQEVRAWPRNTTLWPNQRPALHLLQEHHLTAGPIRDRRHSPLQMQSCHHPHHPPPRLGMPQTPGCI